MHELMRVCVCLSVSVCVCVCVSVDEGERVYFISKEIYATELMIGPKQTNICSKISGANTTKDS